MAPENYCPPPPSLNTWYSVAFEIPLPLKLRPDLPRHTHKSRQGGLTLIIISTGKKKEKEKWRERKARGKQQQKNAQQIEISA